MEKSINLVTRFCRPIEILHIKEIQGVIKEFEDKMQRAINNLAPKKLNNVVIKHNLIQTMIDGNVCQMHIRYHHHATYANHPPNHQQ